MNRRSPRFLFEAIFDSAYLIFTLVAGIYLLMTASSTSTPRFLYGCMALILGIGDSFHLIPRILSVLRGTTNHLEKFLGYGKMVTSVTMTIFYGFLYLIWTRQYPQFSISVLIPLFLLVLMVVRILLCFDSRNDWGHPATTAKWSFYRNLPFVGIGLIIVLLYFYSSVQMKDSLQLLPVAVILSFAFYLPVALYAHKKPMLGMLMLPKTLAYVWIVCMGFSLS